MKHLVAVLILCVLCASCNNSSTAPTQHERASGYLSEKELEEIRLYVEQFQFEEFNEAVVYPPKPSSFVQEAISRAAVVGETRHLPYAALFALRVYREGMERHPEHDPRTTFSNNISLNREYYGLKHEFFRMTRPHTSVENYYDLHSCFDWIEKHVSEFSSYPIIREELGKIERLRANLVRQHQELEAKYNLKKLEDFAIRAPVTSDGRAPAKVPQEMNRILEKLREHQRTDHLPYLLEYGLNLYLKNLTLSQLARKLPVEDNLMLSELIRLTKIPQYASAHEAGWLNRQFYGPFEKSGHARGYSSYQIYIWYLENWSSLLEMPNTERLCEIEKRIQETGMNGVGGGLVCHYGCR